MATPPLTYAYVVKGFLAHPQHREALTAMAGRHSSELDAMSELTEAADIVEAVWSEMFGEDGKHPGEWGGVWDYEVSEPIGRQIAAHVVTHGEAPNADTLRALIAAELRSGWTAPEVSK